MPMKTTLDSVFTFRLCFVYSLIIWHMTWDHLKASGSYSSRMIISPPSRSKANYLLVLPLCSIWFMSHPKHCHHSSLCFYKSLLGEFSLWLPLSWALNKAEILRPQNLADTCLYLGTQQNKSCSMSPRFGRLFSLSWTLNKAEVLHPQDLADSWSSVRPCTHSSKCSCFLNV